MKTIKWFSFVLPVLLGAMFGVQSCRKGASALLPSATGKPYEILVVMDRNLWNGPSGEALKGVLTSDIPGLPQAEPQFDVSYTTPGQFDNILKPVRNILIAEVSDIYSAPKFSYSRNNWSDGQMILYVKSPDQEQLLEFINNNAQTIVNFFNSAELNRMVKLLQKNYNRAAQDTLIERMGISAQIPGELKKSKVSNDFFWASNGAYKGRMDFVVYTVPYTDAAQFDPENLIIMRDSVMKANIPGGREGSYMSTQTLFPPVFRPLTVNGKYCAEIRALWEMKGDMMGGPFISHTVLDEPNQRLVTAEVFVYAPEQDKRNLLRRLEASLYTLKLPQDNQLPEVPVGVVPEAAE